ncbi:MAG: hypothetical protein AB1486_13545 [Planctomycetota bacterium]
MFPISPLDRSVSRVPDRDRKKRRLVGEGLTQRAVAPATAVEMEAAALSDERATRDEPLGLEVARTIVEMRLNGPAAARRAG